MILGLVAAKDNSSRFLGKNKFIYNGKPLFWHSVEPLLQSNLVDDVYVITDSVDIEKYCHKNNIKTIWRPKNASRNEDKLINILRFGYYNLNVDYNIGILVLNKEIIQNNNDISYYMGNIQTQAKEIHYKEDL
jgi:3-deoxy-manno-octulosonate cytidylyltransferase (CMP-KDO synthetase)